MHGGYPTQQKLFEQYIRGVRVTASGGATWIMPRNHQRAYLNWWVVVWSTVEALGLTAEAVSLAGQPPQLQFPATP